MATTVAITGTGMPLVKPDRAGPGVLVTTGDVRMQFDVGRATLLRLAALGCGPGDLDAVFLTHYHSDHVVGLPDLVLSHWTMDLEQVWGPLNLVAPAGPTTRFCENMLDVWIDDLAVRSQHNGREPVPSVNLIGFDVPSDPFELIEVWSDAEAGVRVLAGQVRHEPVEAAVGYRIETPDGIIAITGDTHVCDEVAGLAADADVVVYEAMRMDWARALEAAPHIMEYHADTRLIGAQMAELGVPHLMLTHLIPPPDTPEEEQAFADDVRNAGFRGEIMVCRDLDTLTLDNGHGVPSRRSSVID